MAEGNPAVLSAFRTDQGLRDFTGDILNNPKINVIDYDGRLYLANTEDRYDIIDLSLADSAGLSNPGGFAIVEKFAYTREAMPSYMRALKDGGVLSVTLWNKEEPPKSVLKLYATMAAAARTVDGGAIADRFFVVVELPVDGDRALQARRLHRRRRSTKLRAHTASMSFDEIYSSGLRLRRQGCRLGARRLPQLDLPRRADGGPGDAPTDAPEACERGRRPENGTLPGHHHGPAGLASPDPRRLGRYRSALRVRHPPAHQRPALLRGLREAAATCRASPTGWSSLQDEWGYLLIWATLGIACIAALSLVLLPLAFGWRTIFSRNPGKFRTIVYFACLGAGYIMVEVGLISKFIQALSNATVSASVLINGHAGVLRSRQPRLGALLRPRAQHHAAHLPCHRRPADRLRAGARPACSTGSARFPMRCGCCSASC